VDDRGTALREDSEMAHEPVNDLVDDGRGDFDFLLGSWRVHNRRLRNPLDPNCANWDEFGSTASAEPIFGGLGNIDHIWCEPSGYQPAFEGFTLRLFDPGTTTWRIWWSSSLQPGHLDPPVEGGFRDGVGTFVGDDVLAGTPVVVRFTWTQDALAPVWEQGFSYDGGETFVHNWTMSFSR
jgi:hypothetical protein